MNENLTPIVTKVFMNFSRESQISVKNEVEFGDIGESSLFLESSRLS